MRKSQTILYKVNWEDKKKEKLKKFKKKIKNRLRFEPNKNIVRSMNERKHIFYLHN